MLWTDSTKVLKAQYYLTIFQNWSILISHFVDRFNLSE